MGVAESMVVVAKKGGGRPWYVGLNCSSWIAVYSQADPKRSIYIDYTIQGSLSSVIISFKGRDDGKWLRFTNGVDTINWTLL